MEVFCVSHGLKGPNVCVLCFCIFCFFDQSFTTDLF